MKFVKMILLMGLLSLAPLYGVIDVHNETNVPVSFRIHCDEYHYWPYTDSQGRAPYHTLAPAGKPGDWVRTTVCGGEGVGSVGNSSWFSVEFPAGSIYPLIRWEDKGTVNIYLKPNGKWAGN